MHTDLAAAITQELRAFVTSAGTRRSLPSTCHIGHPGGDHVVLPDAHDPSLQTDLVARAIEGLLETSEVCAWVTRAGDLAITYTDDAWFAAARHGCARHGLPLAAFVVVTRSAWLDLISGEGRTWSRVRARPGAA